MTKPLAIDLFCGLGGWTEGLLAEGYLVVGFDIERHHYGEAKYPAQLVIQDVLTLHGSQFKDAALIVASPPCQAYSYRAMPWKRAKALPPPDNSLFEACFRIQREACEAAGHHIPLVVENVRGAQKWVGRSRWNFGSFHLWGDVPALMPMVKPRPKVGGIDFNDFKNGKGTSPAFNGTAETKLRDELKNNGGSWFAIGSPGQKETGRNPVHWQINQAWRHKDYENAPKMALSRDCGVENSIENAAEGCKQKGSGAAWWRGEIGSKSSKRKAASAAIAKIPFILSQHIARVYHPANS